MSKNESSLLTYAGFGGVIACCLALELLGGAVILGGVAAAIGLSTGLMYVTVVGLVGVLVVFLLFGYRRYARMNYI